MIFQMPVNDTFPLTLNLKILGIVKIRVSRGRSARWEDRLHHLRLPREHLPSLLLLLLLFKVGPPPFPDVIKTLILPYHLPTRKLTHPLHHQPDPTNHSTMTQPPTHQPPFLTLPPLPHPMPTLTPEMISPTQLCPLHPNKAITPNTIPANTSTLFFAQWSRVTVKTETMKQAALSSFSFEQMVQKKQLLIVGFAVLHHVNGSFLANVFVLWFRGADEPPW